MKYIKNDYLVRKYKKVREDKKMTYDEFYKKTKGLSNPRHMMQGIGDGFVPDIKKKDKYDEIVTVCDERSYLI